MTLEQINERISLYERRMGNPLRPRAVFFDMDGVLYDSMPHHEVAWLESTRMAGLTMTAHDVYMVEGQTGRNTIDQLIKRTHNRPATEEEMHSIYQHKTELFNQLNEGRIIPGVDLILNAVAKLKRIVVTGSSQAALIDRIAVKFPNTFERHDMITGSDVRYGKPNPEPYLMAQERAGVRPHESIVIENAPRGVRAAHEAGSFTIAVNTGPLPDEVLWAEGADLVLPDMHTLLPIIKQLVTIS